MKQKLQVTLCRHTGASRASRACWRSQPHPEEWIAHRMASREPEPAQYWLSTLSDIGLCGNWCTWSNIAGIIERDYQELKNRNSAWPTTKDAAGEVFIITPPYVSRPMDSWWPNGIVFPLSSRRNLGLPTPEPPPDFRPRGSPRSPRAA